MTMKKVEIDVPEEIVPYTVLEDKDAQITRNAMLVYPYIKSGVMSHGKAAEMLGLHKIDLITLYGKLGLPYFDETEEEFEEDLAVLKRLRGRLYDCCFRYHTDYFTDESRTVGIVAEIVWCCLYSRCSISGVDRE